MKKILLPAFSLFASVLAVQAQASAPTNLMVMRLGGVGQSLATSGNTMNLDEYTTTGTLVSTVVIPSSGTNAFICGGTSATEGYISLSANGKYLVWAGYNTNYGWASTSLSTSSGAAVARGVATLDGYGNYALAFTGNVESGSSIRGGVSDGLGNFWIEGGVTGIIYVGNNGPLATVSTSTANERCLNIFNGNLYYSTGSAAGTSPGLGLWEVPGLPTTAGGNNVNTNDGVQFGTTSPEDFVVNPTAGLAYLCDDDASTAGGGIIRYKLTGGIWVSNYTISTGSSGAYSVVANFSGANPVLYATVGGTSVSAGNTLVSITDTGSNSTPGAIAVAPAGYTFRGLSWAPGAYPLITNQPASGTNDYTQTSVLSVGVEGTAPFG